MKLCAILCLSALPLCAAEGLLPRAFTFNPGDGAPSAAAVVPIAATNTVCRPGNGWRIAASAPEEGVRMLDLSWTSAGEPRLPAPVTLTFDVPVGDSAGLWEPVEHVRTPFRGGEASKFCCSTPVRSWFANGDENRLTLAWSECVREVKFAPEIVIEERESFVYRVRMTFFAEPEAPLARWECSIRLDSRVRDWSQTVQDASRWVASAARAAPLPPPDAAYEPVYSTWYAFNKSFDAPTLEKECAAAAKLGMKTIITDDGWQQAYGDWEPVPETLPDMRGHVARVHALGMKYMLWYSMAFVAKESRNYPVFRGKYLMDGRLWGQDMGVLDPRFPEVRAFIVGNLVRMMTDWNLDGYKIDFIDFFRIFGTDPAIKENYAGRDHKSVSEAAKALLAEISARLKALKPDVLLEFRQPYIGPVTARYGNMLRANDCPGDPLANRVRTTNIRLAACGTPVHADMLRWTPSGDAATAAQSILSVIFTTVQYSMVLDTIPDVQKAEIDKWIAFAAEHRDALQRGGFRAHNPAANYPLLEGWSEKERIFAVYDPEIVVPVPAADARKVILVNATPAARLAVSEGDDVRWIAVAPYGFAEVPRTK